REGLGHKRPQTRVVGRVHREHEVRRHLTPGDRAGLRVVLGRPLEVRSPLNEPRVADARNVKVTREEPAAHHRAFVDWILLAQPAVNGIRVRAALRLHEPHLDTVQRRVRDDLFDRLHRSLPRSWANSRYIASWREARWSY